MQAYLIVDADIHELYTCTVFRKLNTTNCYRNGFPSFIVFAYYFRKPTSKVCMYVFFNMWLPLKITRVGTVFYEISQVYEIS